MWGEGWTTQIRPSTHCQPTHWALRGKDKHPLDYYRFEFVQTYSGSEGVMRRQLSDIWGFVSGLSPSSVVYNVVVISFHDKEENTNNEAILTDNYSAYKVIHATRDNMEIQTSFA